MLKYNNTHIFTGYLKQLLSSFNLPTCKIYTREFARYLESTGNEDPRILKSFDEYTTINNTKKLIKTARIGYLKNDGVFNYYGVASNGNIPTNCTWKRASDTFYSTEKSVKGLTRVLASPGPGYDAATHKYLGEYLRFIRDYYNVNLMSMYNCFSDEICSNITLTIDSPERFPAKLVVNSLDSSFKLYKIPVKLFADYTIAIESSSAIEIFCGLYNNTLDATDKGKELIQKTYQKVTGALFSQPFIYDKLNVKFWQKSAKEGQTKNNAKELDRLCWDIAAR